MSEDLKSPSDSAKTHGGLIAFFLGKHRAPLKYLFSLAVFLHFGNVFMRYTFLEYWGYNGFDFYLFYDAAVDLGSGKSPYCNNLRDLGFGVDNNDIWVHYIYPPFFARLLYPLTFFSMPIARKIYVVVCTFLYFFLLSPRKLSEKSRWVSVPLTFSLLLIWQPAILTFRWAQSNYVVLFLFYAAWKLLGGSHGSSKRDRGMGRETLAGFLMGLGAMVKLTPLALIPLFVAANRRKLTIGFLSGCLAAVFISGASASYEYFTEILPTLSGILRRHDCPALHIAFVRGVDVLVTWGWLSDEYARFAPIIGWTVNAIVYSTVIYWTFKRRKTLTPGALVLVSCFLPPLLAARYPHHYILVILPVLFVVQQLVKEWLEDSNGAGASASDQAANGPESGPRKSLSPRARLGYLLIALCPYYFYLFRYWFSELSDIGEIVAIFPFSLDSAMPLGTLAALWLSFPILIPEESSFESVKKAPAE